MNNQRITIRYILGGIFAVMFTWGIHEFVHWLTAELMGYETIMRLNGTSTVGEKKPSDLQAAIISISAPIITLLQGLVFYIYLRSKGWNKYIYQLVFTTFYMRLFAGLLNFIEPNDEARVGQFLGIGTFTISIILSAVLFFMVYKVSSKYNLNWKFQLWTAIIILIASWTLILSDQFFKIIII